MLREEIYPFDRHEEHWQKGEDVFAALKSCTSSDLDKLVRHSARFLPKKLQDVSPQGLKKVIDQLNEEEAQRNEVGTLQLQLRAVEKNKIQILDKSSQDHQNRFGIHYFYEDI